MIFIIEEHDWNDKIISAVEAASAGDVIMCPHIRAHNLAIRMLTDTRPGIMIYVRMRGWVYEPHIYLDESEKLEDQIDSLWMLEESANDHSGSSEDKRAGS